MYLKINARIKKISLTKPTKATEDELIAYFDQLCQLAVANPWRGVEFAQGPELLKALETFKDDDKRQAKWQLVIEKRQLILADSNQQPLPRNWAEAMAARQNS